MSRQNPPDARRGDATVTGYGKESQRRRWLVMVAHSPILKPITASKRQSGRKFLAALGMIALLTGALPVHAAKLTERGKQKRAAEAERTELQEKLSALKRDITRTESARSDAADALAQSEALISETNRALHELADEQRDIEARIKRLSGEQDRLTKAIETQRAQLARLLREQYMAGSEDRIKLLLSGDNPNRINRDLQYMGYVSQAQARLMESLRTHLAQIGDNKEATQEAKDELDEVAQEQQEQKTRLEKEKTHRTALLAQLSAKLSAQRKQADHIERDEQRLTSLVEHLAKLIEEQRKADAVTQEKRRQEQLAARAKEKANRPAAPKMSSLKAKVSPSDAIDKIDNDEPPSKLLGRNELVPGTSVQDGEFSRAFVSLRGQLRLPLQGELLARFGSKRNDGPGWKGLFIRAPEGSNVKAVAGGRVVFADWLRGFGNLIIIDHGSDYLTIYGNNQAVLKRPGDPVKTGDVIAIAGNSGGNEQSGLYFEMRHQGRAFDPMEWITIR